MRPFVYTFVYDDYDRVSKTMTNTYVKTTGDYVRFSLVYRYVPYIFLLSLLFFFSTELIGYLTVFKHSEHHKK